MTVDRHSEVRAILAAVAFLYSDRLPDELHDRLTDPDDRLVAVVEDLVKLRTVPRSERSLAGEES